MQTITPTSPLLTLIVEPKNSTTIQELLAQFHPIMKSLGFGHFEKEEEDFFAASRPSESTFRSADNVFAESSKSHLTINIEGDSILGLKSVEMLLRSIAKKYEERCSCNGKIVGPDYQKAFTSGLLFTAFPIFAGFLVGIIIWKVIFEIDVPSNPLLFLWAIAAAIATNTRFWIRQRKKKRPIWVSILILFSAAPLLFGLLGLIGYFFDRFF